MTRQFCDRCGRDITEADVSSAQGIKDANKDGAGTVTDTADLCARCYQAFKAWLHTKVAAKGVGA